MFIKLGDNGDKKKAREYKNYYERPRKMHCIFINVERERMKQFLSFSEDGPIKVNYSRSKLGGGRESKRDFV